MKTTQTTLRFEVAPSARKMTLEWFSKGPEYCAGAYIGKVIQGVGFGPTEEAAIEAARQDAQKWAA